MKQTKPCKGTSKALGYGCGAIVDTKTRKYGICRPCFLKWLKTPEGSEYALTFAKTVRKSNEKKIKQEITKQKNELNESSWSYQYQRTLKKFNEYIRKRDKDKPCISCDKEAGSYKISSGHFYPQGQYKSVALDERNSHGQCWYDCNKNKHGNLHEYRKRITNRITAQELVEVDELARKTVKFTIPELKEIYDYYKQKIKLLNK